MSDLYFIKRAEDAPSEQSQTIEGQAEDFLQKSVGSPYHKVDFLEKRHEAFLNTPDGQFLNEHLACAQSVLLLGKDSYMYEGGLLRRLERRQNPTKKPLMQIVGVGPSGTYSQHAYYNRYLEGSPCHPLEPFENSQWSDLMEIKGQQGEGFDLIFVPEVCSQDARHILAEDKIGFFQGLLSNKSLFIVEISGSYTRLPKGFRYVRTRSKGVYRTYAILENKG